MTQKLKRYKLDVYDFNRFGEFQTFADMKEHEDGDYVKFEEYEKLKAQLERCENILKSYAEATKDQTISVSIPYDDLDPDDFDIIEEFESGEPNDFGERAREYFKEKEQV